MAIHRSYVPTESNAVSSIGDKMKYIILNKFENRKCVYDYILADWVGRILLRTISPIQ